MAVVKVNSIDYDTIKTDLEEYINSVSNYEDVTQNISATTMAFMIDMMAGFGTYVGYKYKMWREEAYLGTAKLDSSIINIAKVMGYRLNRSTCPRLKVKYVSVPTITLTDGDIVGTYDGLDIVYFGNTRKVEKLDEIEMHLGKYHTYEETLANPDIVSYDIDPIELDSLDNSAVHVSINNVNIPISKDIEDYVIFQKPVDYSKDLVSTKLFLSDKVNLYGQILVSNDKVSLGWMETTGSKPDMLIKDVKLTSDYNPVSVTHYGTDGDDLENIRFLVPLYFTTMRRMVTERDHVYIANANDTIRSSAVERDRGIPYKARVKPDAPYTNNQYILDIDGIVHTVDTDATDDFDSTLQKFYDATLPNGLARVKIVDGWLEILSRDAKNFDFEIKNPTNNVTQELLAENLIPRCCTLKMYYVHTNVTDNPIVMTVEEQRAVLKYLDGYRMAGTKIVLIPANVEHYNLDVIIKIVHVDYEAEVRSKVDEVISKWELTLSKEFIYGDLLANISQIQVLDVSTGDFIKPITFISPNQPMFDLESKEDTYYKFITNLLID